MNKVNKDNPKGFTHRVVKRGEQFIPQVYCAGFMTIGRGWRDMVKEIPDPEGSFDYELISFDNMKDAIECVEREGNKVEIITDEVVYETTVKKC